MNSLVTSALPPLPLLLWETPPGLEQVLAQEGVAFFKVRDPHPLAFRSGRFVLYDSRRVTKSAVRATLTAEHVALDVNRLRKGERIDPFRALLCTKAHRLTWQVQGLALTERVARHSRAEIRRALVGQDSPGGRPGGRGLGAAGSVSLSVPLGVQLPGRPGRAGGGRLRPVRARPASSGRLLHALREHLTPTGGARRCSRTCTASIRSRTDTST